MLFNNCDNSDDPVADILTNNDVSDDDSNILIDADGDGVTDADDTCAETPNGSIVDSNGCSDSQKDTDGDGVTDDLDACADTPEVAMVDENGCELTFIYLDENGITIKATENAVVGENYELDGISYLVIDSAMLYQMIFDKKDVSKVVTSFVTNMNGMFKSDTLFNQDIGSWDVSNVEIMNRMFEKATSFNQDISGWNVSNVTQMKHMFDGSSNFNQDLNSWNVSNVTNCESFSVDATAWTLPKPNFTNCLTGDESVWTGDLITFTKADNTDPNLAENQDRITDNVWLTRANNEGGQIYNAVLENGSNKELSPLGTEWAEGDIENYASLTYFPFRTATVKPRLAIGNSYVMHLVEDNIYLSIRITSWSRNKAGGFSYERSTQ